MIPLLAKTSVVRQRFGVPTHVDFRMKQGVSTDDSVEMSIQPAPKSVMERLPDGLSSRDVLFGVSYNTSIRAGSDSVEPDRLVYNGVTYQVQQVDISPAFLGQRTHAVVTAIAVQALSMPEPA